jgi:hypothetical protein
MPAQEKAKHTPGPWKVVRDGNPLSAGIVAVIEHSERFLAVEEDHFGRPWCAPDTWEANARLIAAAPDLLEACRAVMWWNERVGGFSEPEDERDVLEPLRAAIAKAEGR